MFSGLKWRRETLGADLAAALTVALVSIPEGMAYALVAGVNPVYGLYSGMVTTIVASLTASTSLMVVTLTNALALVAGEQLVGLSSEADPIRAYFTLTLLVGVIMFLLGWLKLGSVIRFVSREVMSGFIFATALLIVLGQYKDLVGYASLLESNKLFKAVDITLHAGEWNYLAALVGFGAIALLFLLKRSRLRKFADILIILAASLFVLLTGWEEIELVGDIAVVPSGLAALPAPVLPDFSLVPALIGAALAAAVVGLAESSGIGAAYPNPDGSRPDMSRDFSAQGLGNMVGSFFQSLPAGGSLSRSGLNVSGGAQSRWAGVYSGLLMALTLVLFGRYAELIPMTGLAALLIVIGLEVMAKEGRELAEAWRISRLNTALAVLTILVGVFTDLTVAIFTGVVLSLLLFAFQSAQQFRLVTLRQDAQGEWYEEPLPERLPADQALVFELRGNAYFATVYSLYDLLPDPTDSHHSVVILRLRDRQLTSLTGLIWLEDYAARLQAAGGRLMLAGLDGDQLAMLERTELPELLGEGAFFLAEPRHFAAVEKALAAAQGWIAAQAARRPEK